MGRKWTDGAGSKKNLQNRIELGDDVIAEPALPIWLFCRAMTTGLELADVDLEENLPEWVRRCSFVIETGSQKQDRRVATHRSYACSRNNFWSRGFCLFAECIRSLKRAGY